MIRGAEDRPPRRTWRRWRWSWHNPRLRAVVWQVLAVVSVAAIVAAVATQTAANLQLRGLASGFDYLHRAAGFEVTPGPLSYTSRDTYARALALGLVNTLRVAAIGIVLATVLGLLVGVARLSTIWAASRLAAGYVEVVRNTPLLLQLLFWYSLTQALPGPREALRLLPGVFLCSRGIFAPGLVWDHGWRWVGGALLTVALLAPIIIAASRRRREQTGRGLPTIRLLAGAALVLLWAAVATGRPQVEHPAFTGFDFHGGLAVTPEFAALLVGLSTYTAAFIAEIVRGGILAVDRGQTEAAMALGLSRRRVLRLVVLPQALRVIIPPANSQFLNLFKNSSLAVAIGYPDLISITNTSLNQTGQAIESIAVAMTCYLAIGLLMSLVMNLYNDRALRRGMDGAAR
jgi:general L-amino acid transport system permease protein